MAGGLGRGFGDVIKGRAIKVLGLDGAGGGLVLGPEYVSILP